MDLSPAALLALLADDPDAEPRRSAVLDAAYAAFLDFGVRRTTMGEIARRSGVSPATLYRWFESRDGLVRAVLMREARRVLLQLQAATDPKLSPLDQLVRWGVLVVRRLARRPLMERLVAVEPEFILPALTAQAGPILAVGRTWLALYLRRQQAAGRLRDELEVEATAELLVRVVHSLLMTPETGLSLADEAQLERSLRAVLSGVLAG